ncbi:NlpC/P60 family protein [Longispora sp. NPDC051575]|uniref:C40 family peptidase n=1 Tax=Longispora sp. NPDC051575 TaxID=3154943 RepID=UPI003438C9A4
MTTVSRKPLRVLAIGCLLAVAATLGASPAQAEPTPAELAAQIDKASEELEKVIESFNKVTEQLKVTRESVDKLNIQLKPAQDKVDAARGRIGAVAAAAYKGQSVSSMSALLSSQNPSSLMEQLTILDQFAYGQQQEISAYNQAKSAYDGEKTKLDAALNQQTAQEKELAGQKAKIEEELKKLQEQRKKAGIGPGGTVGLPAPHLPGTAGKAVDFAYGVVGKPYIFNAAGPNGYDCSGLTMAAWKSAGVSLPHNAAMQWDATAHIQRGELQPGDLVFSNGLGHVAIYVGNDKVIHAPQPGQNVMMAPITQIGSIYGYGRVRG